MGRPHVVLLGAGASLAACPTGDSRGRQLPLMSNLVDVVGLAPLLEGSGVSYRQRNFEEVYSEICADDSLENLRNQMEHLLFEYFADLKLPYKPTLYDHLVLCLRPKDVIATFNWDPFLFQAAARNRLVAESPHLLFLHGNTAVGSCREHRIQGPAQGRCRICNQQFEPSPLLYPVDHKNYSADPYIRSQWELVHAALEDAYLFTIFGYSAPTSDADAVQLMKKAWGEPGVRNLEEIEIIDRIGEDELRRRWKDFIHSHHYRTAKLFGESWTARHPRRTCESMWRTLMEAEFLEDNSLPKGLDFPALWEWLKPLIAAETSDAQ